MDIDSLKELLESRHGVSISGEAQRSFDYLTFEAQETQGNGTFFLDIHESPAAPEALAELSAWSYQLTSLNNPAVDLCALGATHDQHPYFLRSAVTGPTLASKLSSQWGSAYSTAEAIELLRPLARALDEFSTAGAAHFISDVLDVEHIVLVDGRSEAHGDSPAEPTAVLTGVRARGSQGAQVIRRLADVMARITAQPVNQQALGQVQSATEYLDLVESGAEQGQAQGGQDQAHGWSAGSPASSAWGKAPAAAVTPAVVQPTQVPPAQVPPAQEWPTQTPPASTPPAYTPPVYTPPAPVPTAYPGSSVYAPNVPQPVYPAPPMTQALAPESAPEPSKSKGKGRGARRALMGVAGVALLVACGVGGWALLQSRGTAWEGEQATIASDFPMLISAREGATGWQDLQCLTTSGNSNEPSGIRCANEELGITVLRYGSQEERDSALPNEDAQLYENSRCSAHHYEVSGLGQPVFLVAPQDISSNYLLRINGQEADALRAQIPVC